MKIYQVIHEKQCCEEGELQLNKATPIKYDNKIRHIHMMYIKLLYNYLYTFPCCFTSFSITMSVIDMQ